MTLFEKRHLRSFFIRSSREYREKLSLETWLSETGVTDGLPFESVSHSYAVHKFSYRLPHLQYISDHNMSVGDSSRWFPLSPSWETLVSHSKSHLSRDLETASLLFDKKTQNRITRGYSLAAVIESRISCLHSWNACSFDDKNGSHGLFWPKRSVNETRRSKVDLTWLLATKLAHRDFLRERSPSFPHAFYCQERKGH